MTQEDKQLLLVDLCARLPYGVIMTNIKLPNTYYPLTCQDLYDAMFDDDWDDVPYLRPKSSMTEDELQRYHELCDVDEAVGVGSSIEIIAAHDTPKSLDYLNSIHVDYRGQIPKGLAIEVTEDNNPYKN
jgi:hypothetical protein